MVLTLVSDQSESKHAVVNTKEITGFLKAMAHEGRLMILCRLAKGEASVATLEDLLSARQAAVSQQLARLRLEGLVSTRREGKTIYYSLTDDRTKKMLDVVNDLFKSQQPSEGKISVARELN